MARTFPSLFAVDKPVLGMLHLAGSDPADRVARALRETDEMIAGGIDGLVIENYYGQPDDVRRVLDAFALKPPSTVVGINLLRDFRLGFRLARDYCAAFLQIDSVAGHLPPDADVDYAAELQMLRASTPATLLGGVRFKYQPIASGRSEAEDLRLGMRRADAIVVTGEGTGLGTDNDKVLRFRSVVGPAYPLLVGAGMTAAAAAGQMRLVEGAIVGSYFKHGHKAENDIEPAHVQALMTEVRKVRKSTGRAVP